MTLDDVERAAGVRRSQLHHYFDDRDDLSRPTGRGRTWWAAARSVRWPVS
ncbi:hypothetical protein [Streptomyces griseoluteus]